VPRLLFFGVLFTIALGGCGVVLHRGSAGSPAPAELVRTPRLADTERLVILGAVGALFGAFLLLQLSYLFGNAPVIPGSGVTFAEYARRGFAELTTVATLCTILLAALDHWAARGPREGWTRIAAVAVVGQVEVLLISALRRLWLYESAYGFTTLRLYAHAYMVAVALFLGMLGWGLARGLTAGWLARRAAGIAALAMAAFFMSWYHGPVTAVLHDMMPRRAHATSVGVYMFATQLVGGLGPHVVGKISDLHDMQLGLQIAVAVMVCGALLMLLVIHFIRRDGLRHRTLAAFHAEPGD